MLRQVLQPEAKARLSRIALVKPERARLVWGEREEGSVMKRSLLTKAQVEDIILKAAMSGQIKEKVLHFPARSLLSFSQNFFSSKGGRELSHRTSREGERAGVPHDHHDEAKDVL